jgi:transcriptional regulator with XRE-family HTH domain
MGIKRIAAGVKTAEIAEAAGYADHTMISKLERGKVREVSISVVRVWSRKVGVPLAWTLRELAKLGTTVTRVVA